MTGIGWHSARVAVWVATMLVVLVGCFWTVTNPWVQSWPWQARTLLFLLVVAVIAALCLGGPDDGSEPFDQSRFRWALAHAALWAVLSSGQPWPGIMICLLQLLFALREWLRPRPMPPALA